MWRRSWRLPAARSWSGLQRRCQRSGTQAALLLRHSFQSRLQSPHSATALPNSHMLPGPQTTAVTMITLLHHPKGPFRTPLRSTQSPSTSPKTKFQTAPRHCSHNDDMISHSIVTHQYITPNPNITTLQPQAAAQIALETPPRPLKKDYSNSTLTQH